jgi:sigma-B regulation protein RsbU (phosphoserine phosphatase)
MEEKILQNFQQTISQHKDTLQDWLNSEGADKEVSLGNASLEGVLNVVSEFKELLEKIEQNEFGKCEVCQGEIELDRLEHDCTTTICLDCYSEDQLRDLERDLELAAKVQQQLLPCCTPCIEGVQIAFRSKPARVVGGDYHDFFTLKGGCQGIAIGDVMGKGLPASMLMSNLQASLRILAPDYEKLEQLAEHLNKLFRYNLKLIKFISLFLGLINLAEKKFSYCNAGHHSPLFWQAKENSIEWLNPTAPAIGLIKDAEFRSSEVMVNKEDIIVFYTDGLIETRNHQDEEYGEDKLRQVVLKDKKRSAEELLADIWKDVGEHSTQITDDITLMVVRFI